MACQIWTIMEILDLTTLWHRKTWSIAQILYDSLVMILTFLISLNHNSFFPLFLLRGYMECDDKQEKDSSEWLQPGDFNLKTYNQKIVYWTKEKGSVWFT